MSYKDKGMFANFLICFSDLQKAMIKKLDKSVNTFKMEGTE